MVSVSWLNNKDIPGLLALMVIISLLDRSRIANNGMSEVGDDVFSEKTRLLLPAW